MQKHTDKLCQLIEAGLQGWIIKGRIHDVTRYTVWFVNIDLILLTYTILQTHAEPVLALFDFSNASYLCYCCCLSKCMLSKSEVRASFLICSISDTPAPPTPLTYDYCFLKFSVLSFDISSSYLIRCTSLSSTPKPSPSISFKCCDLEMDPQQMTWINWRMIMAPTITSFNTKTCRYQSSYWSSLKL